MWQGFALPTLLLPLSYRNQTKIVMDNQEVVVDELTTLKERAQMLGVSFHPSIGLEKLREKVNAAVAGVAEPDPEKPQDAAEETEGQRKKRLKEEALKLVRVRVTCMNPAKAEWSGEILTVGNSVIGSVKKYVPFNADDGWHIPYVLYEFMRDRMCQVFTNSKTKNGVTVRQGKLIREFAIEVLPDLTQEELHDLAQRQAMSKSID